MSWQDKLRNTVFTIRTGDGKLWYPDIKEFQVSKEFNATVFDFISKAGSYVDRKKPRARSFPLKFWFQGQDCVETSEAFDTSANDSRPWIINHPFYGQITGQPLSISRNDTVYNATEINVDFWETITDGFPKSSIAIADAVSNRTASFHMVSASEYGAKADLKPADVNQVTDNVNKITAIINKGLNAVNYSEFQIVKNQALYALTDIALYPTEGISAIQDVLLQPSRFAGSLQYNAALIESIYNEILALVTLKPTRNNKFYFEAAAGMAIAAIATLFINPKDGDYTVRAEVEAAARKLGMLYNDYLVKLDSFYASGSSQAFAYSASAGSAGTLRGLVIQALAGLSVLAFSAKQERIIFTDRVSNIILLTYRYMGLDALDENLEKFRQINGIKNERLFLIPQGTRIVYYV